MDHGTVPEAVREREKSIFVPFPCSDSDCWLVHKKLYFQIPAMATVQFVLAWPGVGGRGKDDGCSFDAKWILSCLFSSLRNHGRETCGRTRSRSLGSDRTGSHGFRLGPLPPCHPNQVRSGLKRLKVFKK